MGFGKLGPVGWKDNYTVFDACALTYFSLFLVFVVLEALPWDSKFQHWTALNIQESSEVVSLSRKRR